MLLEDGDWCGVRALLDAVWYLDVDDAVRTERLIARHVAYGRTPEAARRWVARSDEPNAARIAATRERADLIVRPPAQFSHPHIL